MPAAMWIRYYLVDTGTVASVVKERRRVSHRLDTLTARTNVSARFIGGGVGWGACRVKAIRTRLPRTAAALIQVYVA